jgi:hypothetical protein
MFGVFTCIFRFVTDSKVNIHKILSDGRLSDLVHAESGYTMCLGI